LVADNWCGAVDLLYRWDKVCKTFADAGAGLDN
jgi:hypothetical protein